MNALDKLGLAIANAGYTWTPEMRQAYEDGIKELEAALHEQAEQEPVAWYSVKGGFNTCGQGKPLYAAPVRTKDLTDDEIMECDGRICANTDWGRKKMFARAVIAKDREKNNPLTKSNKGE